MRILTSEFNFNWFAVPVLVVGALMFLTGLFIYSQNRRAPANGSFFLICVCGFLWLAGLAGVYTATDAALALTIYRQVSFLGVAFIATCIYAFSVFWLDCYQKQWWLVGLFFLASGAFYLVGLVSVASFPDAFHYFWGYYPHYGPVNRCFLVFFVASLTVAFYNFTTAYRREPPGLRKTQILFVTLAFVASLMGMSDFLSKLYYNPVYPLGFLSVFLWILIVAYSIARKQLFDIEILPHLIQETRLSAMGLLTSSINHEIKNPLFIIKGMAETYYERLGGELFGDPNLEREKSREAFEKIFIQSERALEIMRNFSEFGKRESGRIFDAQDHALAILLGNVLQLVGGELALDRIELQMNIPDGLKVHIDRCSAEEIFLNLIINACQAMSHGGKLVISAQEEGPTVKIRISDNGSGISANQLRNIFKPFNTTKVSGTGLGLYVVKQLTRRCKGTIQVASEEGKGCMFTLRFPKRKNDKVVLSDE